jgi:chromosome segregation ATPase
MFFALITLFCALSISAIAAYFSIIGLATIFPGSTEAVITMGAVLEVGKIAAAVWLHRNWKSAPRLIKAYLTGAVVVLMGITSMGIFGFLSKAHIEHQHTMDKSEASIKQIDDKIKREEGYISRQKELIGKTEQRVESTEDKSEVNIKREQEKIKNLYEALDKSISYDREELGTLQVNLDKLNKAVQEMEASKGGIFSSKKKKLEELKESQKESRALIASQMLAINTRIQEARASTESQAATLREKIEDYQKSEYSAEDTVAEDVEKYNLLISEAMDRIDNLEKEKFGLKDDLLEVEAEVGPIKYVAALVTDATGKNFDNSQAVRIVIIILIFVFDPLAILLVIAANISIETYFPKLSLNSRKLDLKRKKLEELKLKLDSEEDRLEEMSEEFEVKKDLLTEEKSNELNELKETLAASRKKLEKELKEECGEKLKLEKIVKEKTKAKAGLEKEILNLESEKDEIHKKRDRLNQELDKIQENIEESKKENSRLFNLTESIRGKHDEILNSVSVRSLLTKPEIKKITKSSREGKKLFIKTSSGAVYEYSIDKSHATSPESVFEKISEEMENFPHKDKLDQFYEKLIKRHFTSSIPTYRRLTQ